MATTTLLGLLAGGVGTGLAVWLLDLLATADLPLPIPVALDLRLDRNVLAFTLGVSVVAGTLLGLVPALQSTRPDVSGALRSESSGGGQPGQLRWRNVLVIAQLTISLVLLVGAGLFLRSFQQVQSVDPGFGREPSAILTLAAVGLYGVVGYAVSQRRREVGIRMALGADGARVVRLLVAGGLRLVVIGSALGLALAVVAARLLGGLLFEVDTLDPLTFVGVPLVLAAAALVAAWLPARRARRVHPVTALRTD